MGLFSIVKRVVKKVVKIIGNIVKKILEAAWHVVSSIGRFVKKHWREIVLGVFVGYSVFASKVRGVAKIIGGNVTQGIKNFWSSLGDIVNWLTSKVKYIYNKINSWIEPAVKFLMKTYRRYVEPTVKWVNYYADKIIRMLQRFNRVATVIEYIREGKFAKAFLLTLQMTNKKLYETVKNTIKQAKDKLSATMQVIAEIISKTQNRLEEVASKIDKIGKLISDTAIKLGAEKVKDIGDAIQKIAEKVVEKYAIQIGNVKMRVEGWIRLLTTPLAEFLVLAGKTEQELKPFGIINYYNQAKLLGSVIEQEVKIPELPNSIKDILNRMKERFGNNILRVGKKYKEV